MRNLSFLAVALLIAINVSAQIELPRASVPFENSQSVDESPTGFEIPSSKSPSLTVPRDPKTSPFSDLGNEEEKSFDMVKGDGLIQYNPNRTPKYFSEDKEAKPEYGKDMYLGDIKTHAKQVTIQYRDHEYVDGDKVRVYVNGDIMVSNVTLSGSFKGFVLTLQDGFNKIDFEALNQGSSGPNTAQLQILDETGAVLASYEWNLLTGNKATAIVVRP